MPYICIYIWLFYMYAALFCLFCFWLLCGPKRLRTIRLNPLTKIGRGKATSTKRKEVHLR